jgi:hypothetical protein
MIKRQAQHLMRAAETARRLEEQSTPTFQPHINRRSTLLVAEAGRGSFEQRLAKEMVQRSMHAEGGGGGWPGQEGGHYEVDAYGEEVFVAPRGGYAANGGASGDSSFVDFENRSSNSRSRPSPGPSAARGSQHSGKHSGKHSGTHHRPPTLSIEALLRGASENGVFPTEATWRPAITAKANACRVRSVEEMSLGDARKREATVRKAMARAAEDEERQVTGRPRVTRMALGSRGPPGHLRLNADAAGYTARVAEAAAVRAVKLDGLKRLADAAESEGCTFAPAVRGCPGYVRRMAVAHKGVKQDAADAAARASAGARPEWK